MPIPKSLSKLIKTVTGADHGGAEQLVAKISDDRQALEKRRRQIVAKLKDRNLVVRIHFREPDALAEQAKNKSELADVEELIADADAALAVANEERQAEITERAKAADQAANDAIVADLVEQTAVGRKWQELALETEKLRQRIFDLGEQAAAKYAAKTGKPAGHGMLMYPGETNKDLGQYLWKISAPEFGGGSPGAKAPRPSWPKPTAPDGVHRAPSAAQRSQPPQMWMPTLVEILEDRNAWVRRILEGQGRYEGESTKEEAPVGLWAVPGPEAPVAAPGPQFVPPRIEGRPSTPPVADPDDGGLADILGDPSPAQTRVSDSEQARLEAAWLAKQGITSSVADGERISEAELEALANPKARK